MPDTALTELSEIDRRLAEINEPSEAKDFMADLAAMETWARKRGMEKAKIRKLQKAQRDTLIRMGELLAEQEKHPPGPDRFQTKTDLPPTLAEQGITKTLSHRAQLVAEWARAKADEYADMFEAKPEEDDFTETRIYSKAWEWKHEQDGDEPIEIPDGTFACIVIDPPWPYGTKYHEEGRRAANPYPELSIEALSEIELPAAPDSLLWLWTTNAFMHDAYHLLQAWGFEAKSILTWVKDRMGLGSWLRGQTEHCILAVRGRPKVRLTNQTTALVAPMRQHSRKPEQFYNLIEAICDGPFLEMFSRQARPGWAAQGNELAKFDD